MMQRHGCNAIRCHGAMEGQGELHLSLRSGNPADDWNAIAAIGRQHAGSPSGWLAKPTARVDHGGGRVWPPGGPQEQLIKDWIDGGAVLGQSPAPRSLGCDRWVVIQPGQIVRPACRAISGDPGSADMDVTHLVETYVGDPAVAERLADGSVRGVGPGCCGLTMVYRGRQVACQVVVVNQASVGTQDTNAQPNAAGQTDSPVDGPIGQTLRLLGDAWPAPAPTGVSIRRLYFDLSGGPPTDAEIEQWTAVAEKSSTNRMADELIDALIRDPRFAIKWGRWFGESMGLDETRLGAAAYAMKVPQEQLAHQWLAWCRRRIAGDESLFDMIAGHITSTSRGGDSFWQHCKDHQRRCESMRLGRWHTDHDSRPGNDLFWTAISANGDMAGESIAARTLGLDMQCARCHDHPGIDVSQSDHRALEQTFSGVVYQEQTLTGPQKRRVVWGLLGVGTIGMVATIAIAILASRRYSKFASVLPLSASVAGAVCLFIVGNYLHLIVPAWMPQHEGLAANLYRMADPLSDRRAIAASDILMVAALVSVVGLYQWIARLQWIARRWSIDRRPAIAGAAVFVGLVLLDLGSLTSHPSRTVWVHATHRAALRLVGMGGQNQQPREIYWNASERDDPRTAAIDQWIHHDPDRRIARNLVNRVWKEVFGEGLVEPVGELDFRHPPTHPEVLDQLAGGLIDHDGSLRWLLGQILASKVYRSAGMAGEDTAIGYRGRWLSAAERIECLASITGASITFSEAVVPPGGTAHEAFVRRRPRSPNDRFLATTQSHQVGSVDGLPIAAVRLSSLSGVVQTWVNAPGGTAERLAERLSQKPSAGGGRDEWEALFRRATGRSPDPNEHRAIGQLIDSLEPPLKPKDARSIAREYIGTLCELDETYINF